MPRYRFVGDFETVLHDLRHGVNATLHRKDHGQPDGSTVVARPGDEITCKHTLTHSLLAEVKTASKRKPRAPRKATAKKNTASSASPAADTAATPEGDKA